MNEDKIQLRLVDEELWMEFEALGNEMIVTKNGRCMFPLLRLYISYLDPLFQNETLKFSVKIERCDKFRWKFRDGQWKKSGIDDDDYESNLEHFYESDDSPNNAQYWRENGISFAKVKLTNRPDATSQHPPSNYFCLTSFRSYIPVIYCSIGNSGNDGAFAIYLPHTKFIAVTHYQNHEVTMLKKSYNPHAKGFLSHPPNLIDSCSDTLQSDEFDHSEIMAGWILGNMMR
jgi:hypothetical protein